MKKLLQISAGIITAFSLFNSQPIALHAQGSDAYGSGIKFNLNESGSKYVRFITWHQVWTRWIDNNPGSFINDAPVGGSWDIGLRRSRFILFGKITDDVMIMTHFGINNQTNSTGGVGTPGRVGLNENPNSDGKKPQIFMHDAWVEFRVAGNKKPTDDGLSMGFGMHYFNGLSRLSMASTLNFLAMDAPIYNWTTIEASDQFARMMGIYIKGKALGFDYTAAYDMPFRYPAGTTFTALSGGTQDILFSKKGSVSNYASNALTGVVKAYAAYEFLDKENKTLPFTVGTYIGTKKVFNVGAGFQYQADGMMTRSRTANASGGFDTTTKNVNMLHWAVDAFLDYPLSSEKDPDAITAYAVYYNMNFGANYVRNVGIMNPATRATSGQSFNGSGNAFPMIGTGTTMYGEIGYVFPGRLKLLSDGVLSNMRVQPYAAVTLSNFEGLNSAYTMPEFGINWYFEGHNAKLTTHVKTRPVYDTNLEFVNSRAEFITQAMIYF